MAYKKQITFEAVLKDKSLSGLTKISKSFNNIIKPFDNLYIVHIQINFPINKFTEINKPKTLFDLKIFEQILPSSISSIFI